MKRKLPPKPACGSIEMNKIIGAVNRNEPNPCTENQEQINFYNKIKAEKEKRPDIYFGLVESDGYEDALYRRLI